MKKIVLVLLILFNLINVWSNENETATLFKADPIGQLNLTIGNLYGAMIDVSLGIRLFDMIDIMPFVGIQTLALAILNVGVIGKIYFPYVFVGMNFDKTISENFDYWRVGIEVGTYFSEKVPATGFFLSFGYRLRYPDFLKVDAGDFWKGLVLRFGVGGHLLQSK